MDNILKQPDADKFDLLDDKISIDLGVTSTDERIVISGNDQVIFVKRPVEEPIRVGPPLESRTINVVRQGRTV